MLKIWASESCNTCEIFFCCCNLWIISNLSLLWTWRKEEARPVRRHPSACPTGKAFQASWRRRSRTGRRRRRRRRVMSKEEYMEGEEEGWGEDAWQPGGWGGYDGTFATCLLPLQLLLQGSFLNEEVNQPHCRDDKTLTSCIISLGGRFFFGKEKVLLGWLSGPPLT